MARKKKGEGAEGGAVEASESHCIMCPLAPHVTDQANEYAASQQLLGPKVVKDLVREAAIAAAMLAVDGKIPEIARAYILGQAGVTA